MSLRSFAERPPSEVEWEDLLVRLEIVPRALRLAVEDAGDSPEVREVLNGALAREWAVNDIYLPALRAGQPVHAIERISVDAKVEGDADARAMADTFARLRERNFAQVQRRGLNVWEWRSELEDGEGAVTAYQLMQWMARMDGETLAALRGGGR